MRRLLIALVVSSVACGAANPESPAGSTPGPLQDAPEPALTAAELARPWVELYVPGAADGQLVRTDGGFVTLSRVIEGGKALTGVYNYLYRSTDGIHWHRIALEGVPAFFGFRGLAHAGGRFVLTGSGSTSNEIWTSTDLATWTRTKLPLESWALAHAGHAHDRFFAFTTRQQVFVSTDTVAWQPVDLDTIQPSAVAFGAGRYVLVGSGPVQLSDDGVSWRARALDCALPGGCITDPSGGIHQGAHFRALHAGDHFYVGALWSTDGESWSAHRDPIADDVVGDRFFARTLVDDRRELHAWQAGQPALAIALEQAPAPAATFVAGAAPDDIDGSLPGGETCLSHRCVLVDGRVFLVR
jgi:hypothetical protein